MTINGGIFGPESRFDDRYVPDYERLKTLVGYWKDMGLKIVLTSGSFDLIHGGHAAYLEQAKNLGELLVVGVDSDEKVRKRKERPGIRRPIVPEGERLRMLAFIKGVDVVTIKPVDDPRWHLIKTVRPDVLVFSEDHDYSDEEIKELEQNYCGQVVVLPRMGETTTSARLRLLQIDLGEKVGKGLADVLPQLIDDQVKRILEGD